MCSKVLLNLLFSFFPFVYCLFLSIISNASKQIVTSWYFHWDFQKNYAITFLKPSKQNGKNYLCFGFQLCFMDVPLKLKDQNLFLFMFPSSFVPNKFPNCCSYMCSHFLSIIFTWSPLHGSHYWFTCSLGGDWTFSFLLLHRP